MKLPEVSYRGVSAAQTTSPNAYVRESAEKTALLNKAMAGANEVAEKQRGFILAENEAGYSAEMSEFRQKADQMDTISAGEALALNEEYGIDIKTEGKKFIRKNEWYPQLLSTQMEKTREKYVGNIRSPIDRKNFERAVIKNENAVLEREISIAAEQSREHIKREELARIDVAIKEGDPSAVSLIRASSAYHGKPEQMEEAIRVAELSMDEDDIRDKQQVMLETGNADGLNEYATYLRSDEAKDQYRLSPEQLDAAATKADAAAKGVRQQAQTNIEKSKAYNKGQYLDGLYRAAENGTLTYAQVTAGLGADYSDSAMVTTANNIWKNYVDSGGKSSYPKHRNVDVYNETRRMVDDRNIPSWEVKKFYDDNAGKYTKEDSDALYKSIVDKDKPVGMTRSLIITKLKDKLGSIGINSKDSPDRYYAAVSWLDIVMNAADEDGRAFTSDDANKAIDDIYRDAGSKPGTAFDIDRPMSWNDAEGDDIWSAIKQHDQEMIPEIMWILDSSNRLPTKANIEQAYRDLLKD